MATCKRYDFEGIVLEVWSQLGGRVEDTHILQLVADVGKLQQQDKRFNLSEKRAPSLLDLSRKITNPFIKIYFYCT